MNDPTRPPLPVSASALLRYLVVAEVEALVLRGWPAGAAVRHVAGAPRVDLDGRPVRISVRTLQRWRTAWASGKLAALEPQQRTLTTTSLALSPELVTFLRTEKQRDARASVPELVRRARERGIISVDAKIDRTTVWRACRRIGLPTRQRPHKREADTRRWRYAERMQCVLADGTHFRAGAARLRRVALFFLDDATRYGLDVLVGTAESSELFLRALYEVVMHHGLADLYYLDKGPGFIAKDTLAVVQGGLGALLIHGATRYPEGHGAIERFHRTAYDQVLRSFDGAADVDPACEALTLRLRHFLNRYNDTPHETLGKDTTPRQRWEQGRDLRFPTDDADLYRRFVGARHAQGLQRSRDQGRRSVVGSAAPQRCQLGRGGAPRTRRAAVGSAPGAHDRAGRAGSPHQRDRATRLRQRAATDRRRGRRGTPCHRGRHRLCQRPAPAGRPRGRL